MLNLSLTREPPSWQSDFNQNVTVSSTFVNQTGIHLHHIPRLSFRLVVKVIGTLVKTRYSSTDSHTANEQFFDQLQIRPRSLCIDIAHLMWDLIDMNHHIILGSMAATAKESQTDSSSVSFSRGRGRTIRRAIRRGEGSW